MKEGGKKQLIEFIPFVIQIQIKYFFFLFSIAALIELKINLSQLKRKKFDILRKKVPLRLGSFAYFSMRSFQFNRKLLFKNFWILEIWFCFFFLFLQVAMINGIRDNESSFISTFQKLCCFITWISFSTFCIIYSEFFFLLQKHQIT